jgi:hypothetical protein
MAQYKVDFRSIPWETPMDGLRFKANKLAIRCQSLNSELPAPDLGSDRKRRGIKEDYIN